MKFAKTLLATSITHGERGNVAIIFALVSSVSLGVLGASIELTRIANTKASLAAAADAGALAAKREQADKASLGETLARAAGVTAGTKAFLASAPGSEQGVSNLQASVTWDDDGSSRLTGSGTQSLILGGIVGRSTVSLSAVGVATAGTDRRLEVAVVVDTTASMFQRDGRPTTRFTQMRSAAKGFVNTLFDTVTIPDRLRVAVIPWTTTVNIRSEVPDQTWNKDAAIALSPADAGTRSLPTNLVSRTANITETTSNLNTLFAPVGWRGCISGAGESLSANDDTKAGMSWNALRVPPRVNNATRTKGVSTPRMCDNWTGCPPPPPVPPPPPPPPKGPPPPPPPPPPQTQGKLMLPGQKSESFAFLNFGTTVLNAACVNNRYSCPYLSCPAGSQSTTAISCSQNDNNGTRNAFFNFAGTQGCVTNGGCQWDLNLGTANGCVADYNEITWNNANGSWCSWVPRQTWDSFRRITGPNLNCPMPMLGLSANRTQLINTIDRLSPSPGGTHADVGLRWGLRALSPRNEWKDFFQHNRPEPFDSSTVTKVMVLMTDGANEQAVNFPGYWGCNESGSPGCSGSPDRATLDSRMQSWCTAIRDTYKIELYTVAINVSDSDAVSRLRTCAGSADRAFAVDASQLNATFEQIARETFSLRLKE
jgi:Flp pilus assembly protein TadG